MGLTYKAAGAAAALVVILLAAAADAASLGIFQPRKGLIFVYKMLNFQKCFKR